jgi:hypothetical protein
MSPRTFASLHWTPRIALKIRWRQCAGLDRVMILTTEEILSRVASREAMADAARTPTLTEESVLILASRGVRASLEDLDVKVDDVPPAMLDGLMSALRVRCWQAHEDYQQSDSFDEFARMGRTFERAQYLGDLNA